MARNHKGPRKIARLLRAVSMTSVCRAASALGATYYVAASGSDANSGTSTAAPWLHAPGMAATTGNAASASINPGDSIIFRGGDTWHLNGTSSPSITTSLSGTAWN